MLYEERYLQRRFHSEQYLHELQLKQRNQLIRFGHSNIDEILNKQIQLNIEYEQRFQRFVTKHNGDKPLLILDVDNTMIAARFFSDEMRIGDTLTYFCSEAVPRDNATVIQLQQTLTLTIINSEIIDALGVETIKHAIWIDDNSQLKRYKYKNEEIFFYEMSHPLQQELKIKIPCKVFKTQITGCRICVDHTIEFIEQQMTNGCNKNINLENQKPKTEEIMIDFVRHNQQLSRLEPCLYRDSMLPVDLIYMGFLIRLRPNLAEFIQAVQPYFDVVIFTAAKEEIYKGLLEVLHEYLKEQMGRQNESDLRLWSDVLFRKDCVLKYDLHNKPYHHKEISNFGCDLSRVVMVDNSPIVLHKEEPNAIFIKDFFGKDNNDNEVNQVIL